MARSFWFQTLLKRNAVSNAASLSTVAQGVKLIEYDSQFSDEEKKQSKVLQVSCNLNDAACQLKLRSYKEAEKLCTKVSQARLVIL